MKINLKKIKKKNIIISVNFLGWNREHSFSRIYSNITITNGIIRRKKYLYNYEFCKISIQNIIYVSKYVYPNNIIVIFP